MNAIPLINNAPRPNINVGSIGSPAFNPVAASAKLGGSIGGNVMRQNPYGNETQLRQEVNTSIVALKREAFSLENLIAQAAQTLQDVNNRLSELEGKQGDYVKKADATVSSVGGDGKYISAISETDGVISATATDLGNMVPVNSVTSGNMHSVTSGAVASMFEQHCLPGGVMFVESFDIAYQSGGVWYDNDVWWRVFESTSVDSNYSKMYIEITVINVIYDHSAPNVTKYIVSPQYRNTYSTIPLIQLYKSNGSCHGIRVGKDSNNHWFVDLYLRTNDYIISAQGIGFKRSAKQSKVDMNGFTYVSTISN